MVVLKRNSIRSIAQSDSDAKQFALPFARRSVNGTIRASVKQRIRSKQAVEKKQTLRRVVKHVVNRRSALLDQIVLILDSKFTFLLAAHS